MDAAIQNLDFLRRLIEEARQEQTFEDMLRLRMLHGSGLGTDAVRQGDEE